MLTDTLFIVTTVLAVLVGVYMPHDEESVLNVGLNHDVRVLLVRCMHNIIAANVRRQSFLEHRKYKEGWYGRKEIYGFIV